MTNLENDLKRTMQFISAGWIVQNNKLDQETNFVYEVNSLDDCLIEIERTGVNKSYALHRWYNFKTSLRCEEIFCEYGAVHENDKRNHDVDIYINGVPFDVKLTVYPAKLSSRPYDLTTRMGKDGMIRWFYKKQSQGKRKQLVNRLYVVCDAPTAQARLATKSNFELMREKVSEYMASVGNEGFNEITIWDGGKRHMLKSDIIYLR